MDLQNLAQLYDAREAAPEEIVVLVLERIAAYSDPDVWTHIVPATNRSFKRGPLASGGRLAICI
jgi:hypothetical protein